MLEEMPPELLAEWMALYQLEAEERKRGALDRDMKQRAAQAQARAKRKR